MQQADQLLSAAVDMQPCSLARENRVGVSATTTTEKVPKTCLQGICDHPQHTIDSLVKAKRMARPSPSTNFNDEEEMKLMQSLREDVCYYISHKENVKKQKNSFRKLKLELPAKTEAILVLDYKENLGMGQSRDEGTEKNNIYFFN